MQLRVAIVVACGLLFLPGCGSSSPSETKVRPTFLRGIAQIKEPQTAQELHDRLARTLASLRSTDKTTKAGRKGKALATRGFTWTLRGIDARLEMARNDSGNLEASVHDAERSDRALRRGARLLRAAGRALDVRVGRLNGF
jgi:hypothetical protein